MIAVSPCLIVVDPSQMEQSIAGLVNSNPPGLDNPELTFKTFFSQHADTLANQTFKLRDRRLA